MSDRSELTRILQVLAIILLGMVFGWSGLYKVMDPAGFLLSVFRFHLLPYSTVNIVSLWIAWLELSCAFVLLFVPRLRIAALWLILGLLIVFTVAIVISFVRGSHIACGCFSSSPMAHSMGWWGILKNLGLMIVAMYAIFMKEPRANQ